MIFDDIDVFAALMRLTLPNVSADTTKLLKQFVKLV